MAAFFPIHAVIGRRMRLPDELAARYPELSEAHFRRGGVFVRLGGWCLGQRTVAAITLWNVIWLAPGVPCAAELLLHELRHVHQFQSSAVFPLKYVWESVRRGYSYNRFEVDAREFAARRLRGSI